MAPELELEGITADTALRGVIEKVEAPQVIAVPSRRWLAGAAGLAVVAPLALVWPAAAWLLPALDLLWLAALVLDAARHAVAARART